MKIVQRYGQWLMLCASIAIARFAVASSRKISLYGTAKPPKDVLKRIEETRRDLNCKAHILPTTVSRKGTSLSITINLRGLPAHVINTFVIDELYIKIQNGGNAISSQQTSNQELWIEEEQSKALLARVQLNCSKTGYLAIKLRRVFASWLANNQKDGVLKLNLPSTQTNLATYVEKSNSYFVIYAYSITGLITKPVKCASYDITIKPQTSLNAEEFKTKICSPPEDISFPFNASRHFDMFAALRKSLKLHPVPRNETVLRNPKCCHGTKANSRKFLVFYSNKNKVNKVDLKNIQITECGCGI